MCCPPVCPNTSPLDRLRLRPAEERTLKVGATDQRPATDNPRGLSYDAHVLEWGLDLLFGTFYGGLIFGVALLAAIPYGIWQGIKRLTAAFGGNRDGNPRTDR